MRRAGQNERESLRKRVERKKQGACRKQGIPQLRWEDCLKIQRERDLRMAEEKQKWREMASDRKICKKITAAAAPRFNKWLVLPIEHGNKE